jgi:hypothetical protein
VTSVLASCWQARPPRISTNRRIKNGARPPRNLRARMILCATEIMRPIRNERVDRASHRNDPRPQRNRLTPQARGCPEPSNFSRCAYTISAAGARDGTLRSLSCPKAIRAHDAHFRIIQSRPLEENLIRNIELPNLMQQSAKRTRTYFLVTKLRRRRNSARTARHPLRMLSSRTLVRCPRAEGVRRSCTCTRGGLCSPVSRLRRRNLIS